MNGQKKNNANSERVSGRDLWYNPDFDLQMTAEDSSLFGKISEYLKGDLDIEDIKSDPAFSSTEILAKTLISDYNKGASRNKVIEKFIRESLSGKTFEEEIENEVSRIKHEINQSNLNEISSEWVKEWHERSLGNGEEDAKTEEIRKFITGSLYREEEISEIRPNDARKTGLNRFINLRYISLAAAVIVGAVFLIRSLLPSYDSDKIFGKYYEPLSAVSAVTRKPDTGENKSFYSAIESYKNGDYQVAASGFSEAIPKETSSILPRFFLGITQIALGKYDKAIDLLDGVASHQGEYTKEVKWYLGLAYIKTGNKIKAIECFEFLAQSPGFYKDRSEKILRLLK